MLTKSHYAAQRLVRCADKPVYKQHMCGVCHALGDGYGIASRLLTNHDMILLNMLTSAQRPQEPTNVSRRCPLNPARHVRTNQDEGSEFAAAVAIELTNISIQDDVDDSNGRDLGARLARRLLQPHHRKALATLQHAKFDTTSLLALTSAQSTAERDSSADPSTPTAEVSAALFVMTARLTHMPHNETALATIGAHYGAYLYLADAYRDFAEDHARNAFNPLHPYAITSAETVAISEDGLRWLRDRLTSIITTIRATTAELDLYRYQDTLAHLLIEPAQRLRNTLNTQLDAKKSTSYRQWRWIDVAKAALFVAPVAGMGLLMATDDPYGQDAPPYEETLGKRKRKNKRTHDNSTVHDNNTDSAFCDAYACLYCGDCTDCFTNDEDSSACISIGGCGECNIGDGDGCGCCGDGCGDCSGPDCS